jgi:hypothetical protein
LSVRTIDEHERCHSEKCLSQVDEALHEEEEIRIRKSCKVLRDKKEFNT